jgi:hypothetical protein
MNLFKTVVIVFLSIILNSSRIKRLALAPLPVSDAVTTFIHEPLAKCISALLVPTFA